MLNINVPQRSITTIPSRTAESIYLAILTFFPLVREISGAAACLPAAALVILVANFVASRLHITPIYEALRSSIVVSAMPGGKQCAALHTPRMLRKESNTPKKRRTAT